MQRFGADDATQRLGGHGPRHGMKDGLNITKQGEYVINSLHLALRISQVPREAIAVPAGMATRAGNVAMRGKACVIQEPAAIAHGRRFWIETDRYRSNLRARSCIDNADRLVEPVENVKQISCLIEREP